MYWKLLREYLERGFSRSRRTRTLGGVVGLGLLAVIAIAVYQRGSRKAAVLSRTSMAALSEHAQNPPAGNGPVVLSRSAVPGDPSPEFISVTLLPARGMEVLQITADVPGRGQVNLLAPGDEAGATDLTHGGAFLVPWAGRLGGSTGLVGSASVVWRGRTFTVPTVAVGDGARAAYGGFLSNAAASEVDVNSMPDGGAVSATFPSGAMDGRWPSRFETTISALLTGRALELSVKVRNTGNEATPVGVGWAPRFAIPSGARELARLRIPASLREVTEQGGGATPTGGLDAVKGSAYDFHVPGGAELGSRGLDDTFVHLGEPLEAHPAFELRDPAARFGLRVSALSPTIRAVHVFSPAKSGFVTISPQMNYDNPFSRRWPAREDTGMVVLEPGQTVEWKVRVELFAVLPPLMRP